MKHLKLLLFCVGFAGSVKAQKGKDELRIIGEATVPIFQDDRGFSGFAKGLYGVGHSGQLTLTTGLSKFKSKNSLGRGIHLRLIPLLAGYKHNVHKFYLEPQAGIGELGGKEDIGGDLSRQSVAAFFWALGAGYEVKRFSAGIRFQSVKGIESRDAGLWNNKTFHYTGLYVGYALFQKN